MYPNLYYLFKELFGVSIPPLKIVNSFGFFVAMAFLAAAYFLIKELRRKQAQGIFTYEETQLTIGKPASTQELALNFFLGFTLGFKILGVFLVENALNNPQVFIFSKQGSWPAGILCGLFFMGLKWYEKNKVKLKQPETRTVRIWPSDRVGDVVIIAAAAGFFGAKLFDNFENWDRFVQDPVGNLLSPSGLTFYGGLICATLALYWYFRKHKISFINVCDAAAPSLMVSYGLGRVGCQVAGDGDWGIVNSAYISDANGAILPATSVEQVKQIAATNANFYSQYGPVENLHHATFKASILPDWFVAYTYPHNVNSEGIPIPGCTWGEYCNHLPLPVFPTPLYEIIVCLLLFWALWAIRKRISIPGRLFAIYLIMNGVERFFIEKIRVNSRYSIFGFHPTQAEIISTLLVIAGVALYYFAPKFKKTAKA